MDTKFLESVAILVGTIIGAGILGIPYVIAKAGFLTGILVLAILGAALLYLHLYVGEISLRTKGKHQLTKYAELYLGKWAKTVMTLTMMFGILGALIAYLIGEGATLAAIFGGNPLYYSLGFFVVMGVLIYIGLKAIGKTEMWLNFVMFAIIIIIAVITAFKMELVNLAEFHITSLFIPYGVIFFAFVGTTAIPELREQLDKHKRKLKKAILIGTLIPIVVYGIFATVVVGAIGPELVDASANDQIASVALSKFLDLPELGVFANLFAVFSMATSFLALGLALRWVFELDYNMNKHLAIGITMFIPLIFVLSGLTTFIQTLGIVGAVSGGVEGFMIMLIHSKAQKLGQRPPEYSLKDNWIIKGILIAMFVLGVFFTLTG